MKPNPEYFVDPHQNVIKDFFKFATQSGTSAGSVSGVTNNDRPTAEHQNVWSGAPKGSEHRACWRAADCSPDGLPPIACTSCQQKRCKLPRLCHNSFTLPPQAYPDFAHCLCCRTGYCVLITLLHFKYASWSLCQCNWGRHTSAGHCQPGVW